VALQAAPLAELLSRNKREGQSFSQVIKAHFSGAKRGRDLREALRAVSLSEATLDAIEAQVKGREADSSPSVTQ
jgi:predicted CopG family antitoxin